jgi:hypothetical protein
MLSPFHSKTMASADSPREKADFRFPAGAGGVRKRALPVHLLRQLNKVTL